MSPAIAHFGIQNTYPYVFGDNFLYSNCRQNDRRGPLRTQRLAVGSLILFGSQLAREFVIDAVFVLGQAQPQPAAIVDKLIGVDHVFKTVVWATCCIEVAMTIVTSQDFRLS